MSPSFLLLIGASAIFRWLAAQAASAFDARLRRLLPPNAARRGIASRLRQAPHRIPEFRTRALPVRALAIAMDLLCCATLLTALWVFPPSFLAGSELAAIQYGGAFVVLAAALVDGIAFAWMAIAAWRIAPTPTATEDRDLF